METTSKLLMSFLHLQHKRTVCKTREAGSCCAGQPHDQGGESFAGLTFSSVLLISPSHPTIFCPVQAAPVPQPAEASGHSQDPPELFFHCRWHFTLNTHLHPNTHLHTLFCSCSCSPTATTPSMMTTCRTGPLFLNQRSLRQTSAER